MSGLYAAAEAIHAAGLSCFPTENKLPAFSLLPKRYDPEERKQKHTWAPYSEHQPTLDELAFWYQKNQAQELALACGPASHGHHQGGLFVIDIDYKPIIPAFCTACGPLIKEIVLSRTRSGNVHLLMICPDASTLRSKKIALRANPDYRLPSRETEEAQQKYFCDIETRGTGGYACAWPTPGYIIEQGSLTSIPCVGMDAVVYPLLEIAMQFNQITAVNPSVTLSTERGDEDEDLSPVRELIRTFRDRHPVSDMLRAYGYKNVAGRRWLRPGKGNGSAGCIVSPDDQIVIAFSSNDLLNQGGIGRDGNVHDSFSIHVQYGHGGNMKEAIHAAAQELGYARPERDYSKKRTNLQEAPELAVTFFAEKESENDSVFLVDDLGSAQLLQEMGVAVLYVPSGTREIGGWLQKVLSYPRRFAWLRPSSVCSPTELLALTIDANMLACPWTAVELMEHLHGDQETCILEIMQYVGTSTQMSVRGGQQKREERICQT